MEGDAERRIRFTADLERSQARLFGYIHSLVRDLDDADDVFQQTCLILWRKREEFDSRRSFFAWACGVARLEALSFLRTRSRSRLYFSDELNLLLLEAQDAMAHEEVQGRREALALCMEKLRQRDRALLEDCYGGPARVSEVAERRGRSPQSVHNSLRRIRRALFECIHRRLEQGLVPGTVS
ncbi:MAG: sigma-70 family RNA polymerase sigma factor [Planctomycetes bacterium]|nr:sigma-70 family RNA polymerase sigma factor [Planctomycetota bacterium]